MLKKIVSTILAAAMLATVASAAPSDMQTAIPSPHAIYVDGAKANVAAYTIGGNNYFKLRDIAAIVNGSEKQFEVDWNNDQQRIDLTSGKPYTTVGGELGAISSANQSAKASTAVVYKDGSKANYAGYNIKNNNYYKLRDVCQSFDIGVEWDGANQRVDIITTESYVPEDQQNTEKIVRNGIEIDKVITSNGKEVALVIGGKEYKKGESGELNGQKFIIDTYFQTDYLYPTQLSDPEPVPTTPPSAEETLSAHGISGYGEYTQEYQDYLDSCGEEIVTKTIRYKIVSDDNYEPINYSVDILVRTPSERIGAEDVGGMDVTVFKTPSNGIGEFTIKMPKSVYAAGLNNERVFYLNYVSGSNRFILINGERHMLGGGYVDQIALSGYQILFTDWT